MKPLVSKKIRNSARGESCTVNVAGVCNYDSATTVLAHLPDESKGMGKKADDLSACYACAACHDVLDRRRYDQDFEDHREWYMRRAMVRTWRRLVDLGIIKVG